MPRQRAQNQIQNCVNHQSKIKDEPAKKIIVLLDSTVPVVPDAEDLENGGAGRHLRVDEDLGDYVEVAPDLHVLRRLRDGREEKHGRGDDGEAHVRKPVDVDERVRPGAEQPQEQAAWAHRHIVA